MWGSLLQVLDEMPSTRWSARWVWKVPMRDPPVAKPVWNRLIRPEEKRLTSWKDLLGAFSFFYLKTDYQVISPTILVYILMDWILTKWCTNYRDPDPVRISNDLLILRKVLLLTPALPFHSRCRVLRPCRLSRCRRWSSSWVGPAAEMRLPGSRTLTPSWRWPSLDLWPRSSEAVGLE